MHVVLGGGVKPEQFAVQRYIAYYRRIRREYETAWKANPNHISRTNATLRRLFVVSRFVTNGAATMTICRSLQVFHRISARH